MPQDPSPPQDAGLQFLDLIGQGGFGAVYRAADARLGRTVAAKVLLDDASGRERFLAEAMITGNLQHPHIIPVHGLEVDPQGRDFFTMPVVQGRTLQDIIDDLDDDPGLAIDFPLPRLISILVAVAEAVAYAHARGVVHRDLKPGNIMLGRFGEVFVLDWGIAKLMGHAAPEASQAHHPAVSAGKEPRKLAALDSGAVPTLSGSIIGTPGYMSPEQANGDVDSIDFTTDVYALGVILHQILHLEIPDGPSDEHPTLARWSGRRRVPRDLAAIANRCRRFARDERYPDAAILVDDLRAWLEDRPVSARPDGLLGRTTRWLRHHRATAALLLGVLASAVVAGITILTLTSLHQTERAALAEQAAVAERSERERMQRRAEAMAAYLPALDLLQRAEWNAVWAPRTIEALQRAIAIDADFPEAHRALGQAFRLVGRLDDAERSFRRAIDLTRNILGHDDPAMLCEMGDLLWKVKRDYSAGEAWYRRAAEVEPGHPSARIAKAILASTTADYQAALADLRHLAEVEPDRWEVRHSLAMMLMQHNIGEKITFSEGDTQVNFPAAIAELDTAIELRPGSARLYIHRGLARFRQYFSGDRRQHLLDGGYADYDIAVRLAPNNLEARTMRLQGYTAGLRSLPRGAYTKRFPTVMQEELDEMRRRWPNDPNVLKTRLPAELALGTGQRLLDDIDQALTAKPEDERLKSLRAELLDKLKSSAAPGGKPGF